MLRKTLIKLLLDDLSISEKTEWSNSLCIKYKTGKWAEINGDYVTFLNSSQQRLHISGAIATLTTLDVVTHFLSE